LEKIGRDENRKETEKISMELKRNRDVSIGEEMEKRSGERHEQM
jgi:hypothetical protein